MFKVGDKVITSIGQVGIITGICTCDGCKSRGFYEPQIKTIIGNDTIWCTDNDKRVNFRSFYQIGDRIYGNVDKDYLIDEINRVAEQIKENIKNFNSLKCQLDFIDNLQKNSKGGHV